MERTVEEYNRNIQAEIIASETGLSIDEGRNLLVAGHYLFGLPDDEIVIKVLSNS